MSIQASIQVAENPNLRILKKIKGRPNLIEEEANHEEEDLVQNYER